MPEPIKTARVVETYSTIGRYQFRDAVRHNTRIGDSVRFSKEALNKLQELKSAHQTEESANKKTVSDDELKESLDLLRLGFNATPDEIRKAYITAINRYHPDKYTNLPQEFRKLAEEKTKEITTAYRNLM